MNFKQLVFGVTVAAAFAAVADLTVSGWSQNATSGLVTVNYTLTGSETKIVTLDVATNGVSIGAENLAYVTGDANKEVAPSDATRTIRWRPDLAWAGHLFTNGEITVKAVAWSLANPPDYLAVSLTVTNGLGVSSERRYYTCEKALPGTITNDCWRGDWLLLRRIHAAGQSFVMGSPVYEQYRNATLNSGAHERFGSTEVAGGGCLPETSHPVSFTQDFYIGVFPVTRLQMDYLAGVYCDWNLRRCAFTGVSVATLRGSNRSPAQPPLADSYVDLMRTRTGLAFDLPTEAQWEFACRAGTTTPYNDGRLVTKDYYYNRNAGFLTRKLGWWCNQDMKTEQPLYWVSQGNFPVGLLQPNAWGLYDMHGHPMEWCRDCSTSDAFAADPAVDPLGTTGSYWMARGICYDLWMVQGRSASRTGLPNTYTGTMGFRASCPCPLVEAQ